MNYKEQIAFLKDAWINEILNDPTTNKIRKLELLEINQLFDYEDSLTGAFDDYEQELIDLIAATGPPSKWGSNYNPIIDNILNNGDRRRYERVSFPGWLEYIDEYGAETDEEMDDPNRLTTVATARGKEYENFVIRKTKEEIIDKIFDYCIENRCIGFEIDW